MAGAGENWKSEAACTPHSIPDQGCYQWPWSSSSPLWQQSRGRGEEKRKEIIINVNAHSTERDPWLLNTAVIHEALHFLHRRFNQNSCYLEHSIISHTHKQAMAPHLARWSHTSGHSSRTVPHLEGRSQIWPRQRETSSTVLRLFPWSPYVKKNTVNELNLNATHAVPSVYLCTQPCARSSLIVPYRTAFGLTSFLGGGAWPLPPASPASGAATSSA